MSGARQLPTLPRSATDAPVDPVLSTVDARIHALHDQYKTLLAEIISFEADLTTKHTRPTRPTEIAECVAFMFSDAYARSDGITLHVVEPGPPPLQELGYLQPHLAAESVADRRRLHEGIMVLRGKIGTLVGLEKALLEEVRKRGFLERVGVRERKGREEGSEDGEIIE